MLTVQFVGRLLQLRSLSCQSSADAETVKLKIHYDMSTIIAVIAYGLAVKCPKHSQGSRQLHEGIVVALFEFLVDD